MRFAFFALAISFAAAHADEEISLQDILSIKEQIRQDREEIALLRESVRGDEKDRELDIQELRAVLSHQEEEIAQLNYQIAKVQKQKPKTQQQAPVGCPPKQACPVDPCCAPPPCCPKERMPLPPPCQRCPTMMRYRPAIEESEFAFRGEFLLWKTLENPSDYALPSQNFITGIDTAAIGPYAVYEYDWDPAFRLAFQYRFCPNFWEAEVQYTYFSNSGSDSVNGGTNAIPVSGEKFLTGTFLSQMGEPATEASSSVDLDYQILDFYLGRRFMLADSMILKVLLGASGAWIDHDLSVNYNGFTIANVRYSNDIKYHAGGIKGGLMSDWALGYGFGIYSQLIFGGFVGSWERVEKDRVVTNAGLAATTADSRYSQTRFAFTTQLQLGLSWQWLFSNDLSLRIFGGYEMNPWFNVYDLIGSSDQNDERSRLVRTRGGIICPQGVTINAQIGF